MDKKLFAVGLGLALSAGFVAGQVTVSVAGLQVIGKSYESEGAKKNGMQELRPFNEQQGTKVAFFLKSGEKSIIRLDKEGSKIEVFQDDQEKNLMAAKMRFSNGNVSFGFPKTSEDGKVLSVEVGVGGVPKKGSKNVAVKGEFLV